LEANGYNSASDPKGGMALTDRSSKTSSREINAENWADFESLSFGSSTISHHQQTVTSTSFVAFESSWHSWLLVDNRHFSNRAEVPLPGDEEDCWMSQLLPLQQHRSRKIPLLRRNPRDNNLFQRAPHDTALSRGVSQYHHYQAAYIAYLNDDIHNSSPGEYLSNEEWVAQRRRREWCLRRRYQKEVENLMLSVQQVVMSSLDDMNEWERMRRNSDQHQFFQRMVADGQTLLSYEPHHGTAGPAQGTATNEVESASETHDLGADQTLQANEQQNMSSLSHGRPRQRFRARRTPVSSQARRDVFHHWTMSAVQLSLDLVLVPWRMVFRNDNESPLSDNATHTVSMETIPISSEGEGSVDEDTIRRIPSSEAVSLSNGDSGDIFTESPTWPSGPGWREDQEDGSEEDDDVDHDNTSVTSSGTRYWSTGTAMETDYDSSCSSSLSAPPERQDWENGLIQFPSVEEEDPHQYEFLLTPEDPLFPEDPFAESFT